MIRDRAARRYAQAGFELAREKGEIDAWERDFNRLADALRSPGAMAFLSSRQVPDQAKQEVLQHALGQPQPLVWNLMRLLVAKGRLALLPDISEAFQELVDEERGITHAQVITAVSVSDDERAAIARRLSELTGKQVQVETKADPEILGGLVARIGDRLIDGSARTRLIALKRQLAGSTR